MINNDTINMLKECNAGIKMGVDSIDEVLDKVRDDDLKNMLVSNMDEHQKLGSRTHELLNKYNYAGKNPSPMAQSMSWIKTNVMLTMDDSDQTIADLITDGCNMGVKSLNRYLNEFSAADEESKTIARDLINLEHQLTIDVRPYL